MFRVRNEEMKYSRRYATPFTQNTNLKRHEISTTILKAKYSHLASFRPTPKRGVTPNPVSLPYRIGVGLGVYRLRFGKLGRLHRSSVPCLLISHASNKARAP